MSNEATSASGPFPTAMVERIDALVRARMAANAVLGAAVGVWLPGHVEFLRAYGTADARSQAAFSIEDKVRIGSITKTFTATAVLLLVDRGILRLDDRLERFASGVPYGDRITVRNLLNMTAGIYNYTEDAAFSLDAHRLETFDIHHVLRIIRRNPPFALSGHPGMLEIQQLKLCLAWADHRDGEHGLGSQLHPSGGNRQDRITRDELPRGPRPSDAFRARLPPGNCIWTRAGCYGTQPGIAGTAGAMISTIHDLHT
jgi:hypothetical protein